MATNLFDLTGKVALVTGASRGIGESIAKLLGEQGAHVIVSSRKIDDCQIVADTIITAGGSAEAIACHVGNMDDISNCFAHIKQVHGKLDILINNAATNPYFGDILDTDLGAYTKTVDVNIRGYFFMCVEGGKLMRDNGGGSIVNTASINALKPGPMQGIYSISKAAVKPKPKLLAHYFLMKKCMRRLLKLSQCTVMRNLTRWRVLFFTWCQMHPVTPRENA